MALNDYHMDPRCIPDGPPRRDIGEMVYRFLRDEWHYHASRSSNYPYDPQTVLQYFIDYCRRQGVSFDEPRIVERVVHEKDSHAEDLLRIIRNEMGIPEGADFVGFLKSVAEARDEAQEELARHEMNKPQDSPEPTPRKQYDDCLWVYVADYSATREKTGPTYCTTHDKHNENVDGLEPYHG